MAAYEGNVDRYSRLRRPRKVENEEEAIVHGVYHSTTFAKYWSLPNEQGHFGDFRAQNAIMARFIMINDLSWLSEEPDPTDLGDPRDYPPSYGIPSSHARKHCGRSSAACQIISTLRNL